jgi:Flp pilus assembly CpaE family ATPase
MVERLAYSMVVPTAPQMVDHLDNCSVGSTACHLAAHLALLKAESSDDSMVDLMEHSTVDRLASP